MNVSIARLHELFTFDATTGRLYWKVSRSSARPGREAGYVNTTGYRRVCIDSKEVGVHRVVWAINKGHWPTDCIDHINGDKQDNRIENLRDVSAAINTQNLRRAKRNNKASGLLGAYKVSTTDKWQSQIRINGKITHLGTFDSAKDAHAAYLKAKRIHHAGNTL